MLHLVSMPARLAMPTGREIGELGALLGCENLCCVHHGLHQPARGDVRELQFRAADLPQGVTVDGRLRERLTQGLTVLVMLVPHRQQVLDGSLDNGLHLSVLRLTSIDPVQDPVGGEGDPLTSVLGIEGGVAGTEPPTSPGVARALSTYSC
jgi:hypothetical protein